MSLARMRSPPPETVEARSRGRRLVLLSTAPMPVAAANPVHHGQVAVQQQHLDQLTGSPPGHHREHVAPRPRTPHGRR